MPNISPVSVGPGTAGPRFYRHSGRAPLNALVAGLFAAVAGGVAMGAAWGFLELYLHLAPGKLMICGMVFGLLGWGFGLGWVPAATMTRFKGRSPVATVIAVVAGLGAAFYAAWVFYIFAMFIYQKEGDFSEAVSPVSIWLYMQSFYEKGLWSIFDGDTIPKGMVLAGFWIAEFFIVAAIALKVAMKQLNKRTFCEQCETWGTSRPMMEISDENWGELQKSLKGGDVNALNGVKGRDLGMPSWCDVKIEGCPTCDNVQTLTVARTVVTQNKKGKVSKKTTELVRRLVLTPEQTVQVAVVAAGLKGSAAEGAEF